MGHFYNNVISSLLQTSNIQVGKGSGSSVSVVVTTKPTMVKMLPALSGAPIHRKKVLLTCTVECSPLCSITWYMNNSLLTNSSRYKILERVKLRDYRTNTLSHVVSDLVWEGGGAGLDPSRDTNLFTCSSSANSQGPGVNSTTLFR